MTALIAANTNIEMLPFPTLQPSLSVGRDKFNCLNSDELKQIFEVYKDSQGPIACRCQSTSISTMEKLIVPISLLLLISANTVPSIDIQKTYETVAKTTIGLLVHDNNIQSNKYANEYSINDSWLIDVENEQFINSDNALDILYDHIDNLQMAKKYFEVDRLLNIIDPSKFNVEILLGFLSVTYFYRKNLKLRKAFYEKIKFYLQRIGRYNEALLSGLES